MLPPLRMVVDRIMGRAELEIQWGAHGGAQHVWLRMPELRGFESLLRGRPGEEIGHLASRISALCPWPHHLAAVMAVEDALGVVPPPAALRQRELGLLLSTLSDRLLFFHVFMAPDISTDNGLAARSDASPDAKPPLPAAPPEARSFFHIMHRPEVLEALQLRARLQHLLTPLNGSSLHAGGVVVGGMSRPMDKELCALAAANMPELHGFCRRLLQQWRTAVLPGLLRDFGPLETLSLPMLGTVDRAGGLVLWSDPPEFPGDPPPNLLRYMQPDGSSTDMPASDFLHGLTEEHAHWTRCAFPRPKDGPAVSLDPDAPAGMYRVGALPRLNACDHIPTPDAQAALEEFRREMGRCPQHSVLYHWARLIEMLYCCERAEELLHDPLLLNRDVRERAPRPLAGTGMSSLEAPRGTLFYQVELDDQACVRHCRIITPSTQNNAAMNVSLTQAARRLLPDADAASAETLRTLALSLRAYDPCPACAVHVLHARPASPCTAATAGTAASGPKAPATPSPSAIPSPEGV